MELSLEETEEQLLEDFHKTLANVKKYKSYDCSYNKYGTDELEKLQAALITVKREILEENRLRTPIPCANGLVVATKLNDQLVELCVDNETESIPLLESRKEDLQRSCENISVRISKQTYIAKKIEEQLKEKQSKVNQNPTINVKNHIKYYKSEKRNVRHKKEELEQKMMDFITENLPDTEHRTNEFQPEILRQLGAVPINQQQYLEMYSFIRLLTIECRDSPQNPYVDITNSPVFPPYLELLLRNNIVVRHPSNFNLIKLCYNGV